MSDEPWRSPEPPALADLLDLSGRVALVTGAGRGIGTAVAKRLAAAGARVAVHYRTSAAGAEEVVAAITAGGGVASTFAADLRNGSEVERLVEDVAAELGSVDVLVNNAGIYPLSAVIEMTETEWSAVIDANLKSVFLMTKAVARAMIASGEGGAIVNIASVEGSSPAPLHSHYAAAKAGVVMHTRAAALELGPHGIRVNAVSPGLIWRPGLEGDWPEGVARWRAAAPLGTLGRRDDVADACLFLVARASRWITGVDLPVDGGVLAREVF